MSLRFLVLTISCLAVVCACTGGGPKVHRAHAPATAPGCGPASPIAATPQGSEIRGTGHHATLYGLVMAATPIRTGEQVKIVWRMTGSGPLTLTTTSPHAQRVPLQWGPEMHAGSNYERPGQEWGAGYLFPSTGCWHLQARRTRGSADVWLRVR